MPPNYFGARVAATYDTDTADRFRPEVLDPTVDRLVALADGGPALEFGIGTGRVALPLAARGVDVTGIDLSPEMVDRLRAKRGGETLDVAIGDYASASVEGRFRLVFLVFNGINNLTTQDAQVDCFCNAARHLEPGGRFVIEVGVPDLRRLPPGETVRAFDVSPQHVGFDEVTDFAAQRFVSHHYFIGDGRADVLSHPFRWVWPSELDLMARVAGMHLEHRWAGWREEPFTGESTGHVSVWRRGPADPVGGS